MSSVYTYCSRCGDELPEWLQEKYEQEHECGPVLCMPCVGEVLKGIPKAIQSMAAALSTAFEDAFSPMLSEKEDDA